MLFYDTEYKKNFKYVYEIQILVDTPYKKVFPGKAVFKT